MTLHHATVKCPYCDRDIEAEDCVEIDEMIQWLKEHDILKNTLSKSLMLKPKDWQYLLNWGRK